MFSKNQKTLQEFVLNNYDLDAIEELAHKKAKRVQKCAKKSRGKHKFQTWKVQIEFKKLELWVNFDH